MPGVELRELALDGESRQGSRLFSRLREALAEIDRARLGAVIALTDGQVHDAPADPATLDLPRAAARAADRPPGRERPPARDRAGARASAWSASRRSSTLRVDDAAGAGGAGAPASRSRSARTARWCASSASSRAGRPRLPFTLDKAGHDRARGRGRGRGRASSPRSTTAPPSRSTACATGCACCWSPASPIRACASGATCSRPTRRSTWSTSPSCARPRSRTARRSASCR